MKKALKTIGTLGLAGLLNLIPAKAKGESIVKNIVDRTSVSVLYSISPNADPMKDWYAQMNQDWKNGKYTFQDPVVVMNELQSPKGLNKIGAEISVVAWQNKKKDLSLSVLAGYEQASPNKVFYDAWNTLRASGPPVSDDPFRLTRTEEYNLNNQSIGIKVGKSLSKKLELIIAGKLNQYNINGKSSYELYYPRTEGYMWRNASFSGTGQVYSIEAGVNWNILKNLSLGISAGQNNTQVKTTGKEIETQNYTDEIYNTSYNPVFNFDKPFGKAELKFKF